MARSVNAVSVRLDRETRRLLVRLRRATGLADSALISRALRALADQEVTSPAPRVIGVGAFASGVDDLASKDRLVGFGR